MTHLIGIHQMNGSPKFVGRISRHSNAGCRPLKTRLSTRIGGIAWLAIWFSWSTAVVRRKTEKKRSLNRPHWCDPAILGSRDWYIHTSEIRRSIFVIRLGPDLFFFCSAVDSHFPGMREMKLMVVCVRKTDERISGLEHTCHGQGFGAGFLAMSLPFCQPHPACACRVWANVCPWRRTGSQRQSQCVSFSCVGRTKYQLIPVQPYFV